MHIPSSNGRRSVGRRLTALAWRWPIAAALLLVGMAALVATPAQAATVTLVSNFGSLSTSASTVGDPNASSTFIQAQKFTTGANTDGYTLETLKFQVANYDGANITPRVSIYSEGNDGNPGSSLYVLTGTITSTGDKTYTAPADATLDASTTYFVYFEDTDSSATHHNYSVRRVTSGSTLDTGSQSGWTIGNRHQKRNAESWTTSSTAKLAIELKGTVDTIPCDALWCATMTAGSVGGAVGYSDGSVVTFFDAMGSLSPSQFLYEGATITVNSLAYDGSPPDTELSLELTGILGNSDYTLELDAESFVLSGPDITGAFYLSARPSFADGDTVAVKLFEGSGGALSDDATLTSLEFHAGDGLDEEPFTLTPAFDAGTTEYTAAVGPDFLFALIRNIVRGHSGATIVVTDAFASDDLDPTDDAAEDLELGVGENTITVEVTAADGNTTITYTLVVTRTVTPPAHCETGDVWCAILTAGTVTEAVGTVSDGEYGYSGAHGTLSHVAFEHDGTAYEVDALYHRVVYGVGPPLRPLRIEFDPSGETVFNTDDLVLYIDGTAFAFSNATFTSTYFEWSNSDLSWTSTDTVEVRLGGRPGTAGSVPSDWSLIPAGLTGGDQFRLLFLSQTRRAATDLDIADYNTFIQTLAAAGHTDIQAYSDGFTVVGCTADVDAVDNTGTTGVGVPIYWLNGAKVADDYADFYDGDWDEEAVNKNELGENGRNTSNSNNYPYTGCNHDGTEAFSSFPRSESLGADAGDVRLGRPNSTTTGHGPLSSNDTTIVSDTRPMYGLSAVFQVPDTIAPSPESAEVAANGDRVTVAFDEDLDIAVEFLPTAVVNAFTLTDNGLDLDIDTISADASDTLVIVPPTGTTIYQNQTVTISYDKTVAGTDALEDAAGNEVASFTDFAVTNNSVVERGRLSVRLQNLPSSHDGNTAFTVNVKFNKDISDDSIDNLDGAVVIENGTKSTPAAVGSSKRNFTMTITPSSGEPVRIRVRGSEGCTTRSFSICTDARQVLDRGPLGDHDRRSAAASPVAHEEVRILGRRGTVRHLRLLRQG